MPDDRRLEQPPARPPDDEFAPPPDDPVEVAEPVDPDEPVGAPPVEFGEHIEAAPPVEAAEEAGDPVEAEAPVASAEPAEALDAIEMAGPPEAAAPVEPPVPAEPAEEVHDEDEDGADAPVARRRRRWFGLRRARDEEPDAEPDEDEAEQPGPGPDWNAVVTGYQGGGRWLDWSDDKPVATDAPPSPPPSPSPSPSPSPKEEETVAVWETAGAPATAYTQDSPAAAPPATPAAEGELEEPRRYRSTPSWPPPPKPRVGAAILCSLIVIVLVVLLVTNGNIGGLNDGETSSSDSATGRPALRTDPEAVPRDWIVFRHSEVEYGLSYPPGWSVQETGATVRFTDPESGAELSIDHRRPAGDTDPEQSWVNEERTASTRLTEYRRLQLSPASYLGHKAALWEYTWSDGTQFRHAADLEFVTDDDRFRLNFEARSSEWERLLPVFQGFLSSFRTPE